VGGKTNYAVKSIQFLRVFLILAGNKESCKPDTNSYEQVSGRL
jgi:hypothetical protein